MCVRERGREARPRRDAGQLLEQVSGCVCALSPDRKVKSIMMTKKRRKATVNNAGDSTQSFPESRKEVTVKELKRDKKDTGDEKRGRADER